MTNMYTKKDLCVIIVTYNGEYNIHKKIEKYGNVGKVLIVDNGSNTEYKNYICSLVNDEIDYINNVENMGIAYALNQGLNYAKNNGYKLMLTMDQDSVIDEDSINVLISALDEKQNIVSVGANYCGFKKDKMVDFLITSGNLFIVEYADKVGGYENKLFIDQVDIDFSLKLKKHGYLQKCCYKAYIDHKIGEYEKSHIFKFKYLSHSPKRFYYMYRNEKFIVKKYRKIFPLFCLKSKIMSTFGIIKVIFVEKNKIAKLKYIKQGIREGRRMKIEK